MDRMIRGDTLCLWLPQRLLHNEMRKRSCKRYFSIIRPFAVDRRDLVSNMRALKLNNPSMIAKQKYMHITEITQVQRRSKISVGTL